MIKWQQNYIEHVLTERNWSMNQMASAAGVAASTINRPMRDDGSDQELSFRTISKIWDASGIDPGPFMPRSSDGQPGLEDPTSDFVRIAGRTNAAPRRDGNEISITITDGAANIQARVDVNGIAKLREKLDLIEKLLRD